MSAVRIYARPAAIGWRGTYKERVGAIREECDMMIGLQQKTSELGNLQLNRPRLAHMASAAWPILKTKQMRDHVRGECSQDMMA